MAPVTVLRAIAILWLMLCIGCLPVWTRTVDVLQFGAKGDGVSKDTKAIQAAVETDTAAETVSLDCGSSRVP